MTIEDKLEAAGIDLTTDSVDVEHLRFSSGAKPRARRFEAFQRAACGLEGYQIGAKSARLIAFDLVLPLSVPNALASKPFSAWGSTYLEWEAAPNTRIERRRLCVLTTLCWKHEAVDCLQEWTGFQSWLATTEEYKNLTVEQALTELELDLMSWSVRNLPMVLWGHVVGLRPMHALPRTTLARDITGLVPAIEVDETQIELEAMVSDFLDVVDLANSKSGSDTLVREARDLLTTTQDEEPRDAISRWIRALLSLRSRAESADVASAVVLAWMIDTIESGTVLKVDADYLTRRRYCRVAALAILRMLRAVRGEHPENWKQEELEAGYQSLMIDESISDKSGLGAAISSFQLFLFDQWDVPVAARGLHKLIPAPRPRAQLVTLTEIHRALDWVDQQEDGDTRLMDTVCVALALGWTAPFRVRELLYLRIQNIAKQDDGTYEIEIVRWGRKNKLKTDAAVRRVHVREPWAVQRLASWLAWRDLEGAPQGDLLFASPDSAETVYRRHAVHRTLLRVLKMATGELDMTFHALRHGWASREIAAVLCSNSIVDFNRLTHVAAALGHVSAHTTIFFYSHLFEDALSVHMASALRDVLKLSGSGVALLLGQKSSRVRKVASRAKIEVGLDAWPELERSVEAMIFPLVTDGINLVVPQCPRLVSTFRECLSPMKTLRALRLMRDGLLSDGGICANTRLSQQEVSAIRNVACGISIDWLKKCKGVDAEVAHVASVQVALTEMNVSLERAFQPRYQRLRETLELSQVEKVLADAARSWADVRTGTYLAIDHPDKTLPLLRLLKLAGINPEALQVRVQYHEEDVVQAMVKISEIQEVIRTVWDTQPEFEPMDFVHDFRPAAYLVWPSSDADGPLRGHAAASIAGLDAILFSVAVYCQVILGEVHAAS